MSVGGAAIPAGLHAKVKHPPAVPLRGAEGHGWFARGVPQREVNRPMRTAFAFTATLLALALTHSSPGADKEPLVIGDTFTIESKAVRETRWINVYLPPGYAESGDKRFPALYMPDGGIAEDFLHVAGLVQVGVSNETMRPFILVGIENTERRRDMTGPTENAKDKEIAPRVGGSEAFRQFIRTELMPQVKERYRTTDERAIVGESLAGLFIVETLLLEPDMFDTYIAFDPSLWWNNEHLLKIAPEQLSKAAKLEKTLYFATSGDAAELGQRFADILKQSAPPSLKWHYEPMPEEKHSTIYHPAALRAFRSVFAPPREK
jgi:predicted alpha/beta superfamily hydrolase